MADDPASRSAPKQSQRQSYAPVLPVPDWLKTYDVFSLRQLVLREREQKLKYKAERDESRTKVHNLAALANAAREQQLQAQVEKLQRSLREEVAKGNENVGRLSEVVKCRDELKVEKAQLGAELQSTQKDLCIARERLAAEFLRLQTEGMRARFDGSNGSMSKEAKEEIKQSAPDVIAAYRTFHG